MNDSLFFTAMANFFRGRFPDALRFGEEALALAEQTDMTLGSRQGHDDRGIRRARPR